MLKFYLFSVYGKYLAFVWVPDIVILLRMKGLMLLRMMGVLLIMMVLNVRDLVCVFRFGCMTVVVKCMMVV